MVPQIKDKVFLCVASARTGIKIVLNFKAAKSCGQRTTECKVTQTVLQRNQFINEYLVDPTPIGKGSFGTVKLGLSTRDFKLYALKLLPKSRNARNAGTTDPEVLREIAVMKELNHPNIVRLHEVIGLFEFQTGYAKHPVSPVFDLIQAHEAVLNCFTFPEKA